MRNGKEIVGLSFVFCSVCLLGWHMYEGLRYNVWMPMSMMVVLGWMNVSWALNPTDWLGLHNILIKTPLCAAMFVFGLIVFSS